MLDLAPATRTLSELVEGVGDDQLGAPTPCRHTSLGDLIDHVDGLAMAFAAAARKDLTVGGNPPSPDASRLGADWRTRIPQRLAVVADAWRPEEAWAGMTRVGGVDLPAEVAAIVAVDEVVVHGWDIAAASGQPYACDPALLQAAYQFVESAVAQNPQGSPGLFGPPVSVPDDAPLIDRLIALTGRDPAWRAAVREPSDA